MAGIFEDITNQVNEAVVDTILGNIAGVLQLFSPLIVSGFTIYVIFVFMSYLQSHDMTEPMWDLIKRILAWGVIISFGLNLGTYNQIVVPFVLHLGDGLSTVFNNTESTATTLDEAVGQVMFIVDQNSEQATSLPMPLSMGTHLQVIFNNAIFIIGSAIFLTIACAYVLVAKVFSAFLAVVGPIFITLALFPATRQYFNAWLNQVINYGLFVLIINVVTALMLKIFLARINDIPENFPFGWDFLIETLVICFVFLMILLKTPELSSGLSSGSSSVGGFSNIAQLGRAMKGLTSKSKGKGKEGGSITPK